MLPTFRNRAFASANSRSLRGGETVAIGYFVYTAVLASLHRLSLPLVFIAWLMPMGLWALASIESRYSRNWSSIARDCGEIMCRSRS